jgi:hypothetical protein
MKGSIYMPILKRTFRRKASAADEKTLAILTFSPVLGQLTVFFCLFKSIIYFKDLHNLPERREEK